MALAKRNPEEAKEWLRMTLRIETSRDTPDPDFIAHLEEGIEIINLLIEINNSPHKPPGFTLADLSNWGDPATWPAPEAKETRTYYRHDNQR